MGDKKQRADGAEERLTHYMHSTPAAGRQMNRVPWLPALFALLLVVVVAGVLVYWVA